MNTLRILLADDHPVVRAAISEYLRAHDGVEFVAEVANGSAAVEATLQCKPDIVLLDNRMPERSGMDATRAIKSAMPDARVYVMSFTAGSVYADQARCMSADGFIDKRTLKHSIEEMLRTEGSVSKNVVAVTAAA